MENEINQNTLRLGETSRTSYLALNDKLSQSLLAVRLLLAEAQGEGADRVEIIKKCYSYLNFALEELRELRDAGG